VPGKPFRSKLQPFEEELYDLLKTGTSYRKIAEMLNERHSLGISHNAVHSFVKARSRQHRLRSHFHDALDADLRDGLIRQIVAVWTHDSTAIEGNTLTLGETTQVLELGLTISGKPLKDHEEVYGHARAIELIRQLDDGQALDEERLFDLHRAVIPQSATDALNPIGDWKRDHNGTAGAVGRKTKYLEYSPPADVPVLMRRWLRKFNALQAKAQSEEDTIDAYTWAHMVFVRIHPFFDGNGRLARLLANLPALSGGWPPVLISTEQRGTYIDILWRYQWAVGQLRKGQELLPAHPTIEKFKDLIRQEWTRSIELVTEARTLQSRRKKS
jgi:Fic family protein